MTPPPLRFPSAVRHALALLAALGIAHFAAGQETPSTLAAATAPPPSPIADILTADEWSEPDAEPLLLSDAIARALRANYEVRIQRNTADTVADAEDIARAAFDPTLSLSVATAGGAEGAPDPFVDGAGNVVSPPGVSGTRRNSTVSASQRLSSSGATITATGNLTRQENTPSRSRFNPGYSSDVGLSLRQPLLRGAGASVNESALERAKLGTERAQADFAASVYGLVRDIEVAYANLAYAREQLGIRSFSLAVRKGLFEETAARRDTGVATDLDVLQSEVGVAGAARDVLLARQSAEDREDELLRLLGSATFDEAIGPVSLPNVQPSPLALATSVERARANTPEFVSALASIRQQEIDLRNAKNARLPQLDFGAQGGYNDSAASAKDAASDVWRGEGYSWQLDLTLRFPWGFREEKARLRQARAGMERESLRYAQAEQAVLIAVRNAVRAVETSFENLRLSTLTAELSDRQFEVEKARYDAGLSTFRRVQESQNEADLARLGELQAKVNLATAQANLDRLEGTAPARYNLSLEQERKPESR